VHEWVAEFGLCGSATQTDFFQLTELPRFTSSGPKPRSRLTRPSRFSR
jgi:hypothetical protein